MVRGTENELRIPDPVDLGLAEALDRQVSALVHERLAEPTRTGDEELASLPVGRKSPQEIRLVHVDVTVLAQVLKRRNVSRDLLHTKYYSIKRGVRPHPLAGVTHFLNIVSHMRIFFNHKQGAMKF